VFDYSDCSVEHSNMWLGAVCMTYATSLRMMT